MPERKMSSGSRQGEGDWFDMFSLHWVGIKCCNPHSEKKAIFGNKAEKKPRGHKPVSYTQIPRFLLGDFFELSASFPIRSFT
jgi:hypothetical protein